MAGGVEYQVTKVDPTDPETKGMVHQVHKVSEEIAATIGGKVYRARIINDPTAPTVAGKVYQIVLIDDPDDPSVKGQVYNAILTGGSEAVVVGPAVSPLSLPDAVADSLTYVKAFGGTGQNGTPTPTVPVDIVSNNGALKITRPSGLPAGYTALEYIDTDGNSWIDTGITPTATTLQFDYKMQMLQQDYVSLFGAVAATSPRYGFRVYYQPAGGGTNILNWQSGSFGGQQVITWNDILQGTVIATQRVSVVSTINGTTQTYTSTAIDLTQSDTMFLGTTHLGNTSGRAPTRTWYFKITKDGTVVRDFVPAKRNSDNVLGMYDLVSGQFFTNQGTGDFVAGPNAVDPITIVTDGTVETIEDTIGNTATTEMLLGVGNYKDVQEILSGAVTRNVGIKVFDGTENWQNISGYYNISKTALGTNSTVLPAATTDIICTHYKTISGVPSETSVNVGGSYVNFRDDDISTLADWTSWLAAQYAAGTPVIVIYPLATPTTESVTGQTLQVQDGDNTLEITQASLTGLELEAGYGAVVSLTVQEAEDTDLDDNVAVTIE